MIKRIASFASALLLGALGFQSSANAGSGVMPNQYQSLYQLENPVRAQPLGYQSVADPVMARISGGISYGVGDASTTWGGRYLKVFLPAGAKFCSLGGYLPQGVPYAVNVRAGTPPVGLGMDIGGVDSELAVQTLFSGAEYQTSHAGGGHLSMLILRQAYLPAALPISRGSWVYIDVSPSSYQHIHALQYVCEIGDWAKYETEFYSLKFDRNGDPLVDQSGGATTDPVTSATLTFKSLSDTLSFDVDHTSSELANNVNASYFVAAVVPRSAIFPHDNAFFYLVPDGIGGYKWINEMVDGNPYSLAFSPKFDMRQKVSFSLPLGLSREMIDRYGVQFYFAYKLSAQSFKDLGKISAI